MRARATLVKNVYIPRLLISSLHWQLAVLVTLSALLLAPVGHAAIFSCEIGDSVVYQDKPCPVVQAQRAGKKPRYKHPLAIHDSWFELPEQAEERAFCSRKACECGQIETRHQGSLPMAVADALFLDGSWHRYESSHQQWLSATLAKDNQLLRSQLNDAACYLMMSQTLLREYAEDVLLELKKQARTAENLGFDIIGPCDEGIADACHYYDSAQLYKRLVQDAVALRKPRIAPAN